ncbi:MAG: transglycosylase SLT domain-containing protein [Bacteriovorax sp.]|nr:transglycosylase SLT domain-containing protein [Bacteriovorax sp.]
MKNILVLGLFVLIFISSCATKPVRLVSAPLANRLEVLKNSLNSNDFEFILQNESEEIAKAYLLALKAQSEGQNGVACDLFTNLAENKNLPIYQAALIHSLSVCDYSERRLRNIWKNASIPKYLGEAYAEESLKLAIKKNILEFEAQFSYDLVSFKPTTSEKISLLKRAILISEQLKNISQIKTYTDRLKEISPLYNTEITNTNKYIIAKNFEANRKFETARSMYREIIEGEFTIDEKVKAYNSYRTSFKVERNLKTFLSKTFEMEDFLKNEMNKNPNNQKIIDFWVDTKIALTRAIWTDHQTLKARELLDDLVQTNIGNSNQLATIQLIYGSLDLESKKNINALKHFEKAVSFKITDQALKENIQWAIVWNNYILKRNKKVVSYVNSFISPSSNPIFAAKLNYWKAKVLLRLNKEEEASELFTSIYTSDPFGYYGIISTIDLKIPLKPISPIKINLNPTGDQILDWLMAMEEKSFSQKYIKEINPKFKTPEAREKAMSLYYQSEWYQGGMRQIYNFKMSSRNAMTEKYINVIFPTPYLDSVDKLAIKYSVPKELIWAISRQESAFVPSERSWADAFGLMQLIPEKAAELAKKNRMSAYHDFNDLYNPEINLELGTALLKNLREKFGFKFAQSVAAYNASESVIKTWETDRFNGNYFEFIEMIPYEETRNYIKLVFRNFITYKRITGKEEFMLDPDFFANPF